MDSVKNKNKMFFIIKLLFIGYLSTTLTLAETPMTLEEKIQNDPDLSEFYRLVERNKIALTALRYRALTVFAPTNQAFQRYKGNKTDVLYHMSTTASTLESPVTVLPSDYEGNPPLYITKTENDNVYINNALIIKEKSNVQFTNNEGKHKQVLHVIDDVLIPLTVHSGTSIDIFNLDAFQFLSYSENLEIGPHRVRSFRQRVVLKKKENAFQSHGYNTYLIPVEEGFKQQLRSDLIDSKVIDGHIIPTNVLFTSSVKLNTPFATSAFEDNLKVTVSFYTEKQGNQIKTFVKSNTLMADGTHPAGAVIAEIVKGNIPVKNGVVHLIQRPLMVVDTTVKQFLEEKEDGPLYKFYETIMDYGGKFMETINNMNEVTLFAPSNEAWNNANIQKFLSDREKLEEILNLHVVRGRYNVEKIKHNIQSRNPQVPTLAERKNLFFNYVETSPLNQTIFVEGGGVNATILQADIASTNGYVHIIDKVLGAPYTTVLEKLAMDPMMRTTYQLGEKSGFNQVLNSTKRFTYFVPSDQAWVATETSLPSAHKKMFMPEYIYHTKNILERHLVIGDRLFTMAELYRIANTSLVALPTLRDSLKIKVKEEKRSAKHYLHLRRKPNQGKGISYQEYFIQWDSTWISVVRPDVECTNGIIHVIGRPFLVDTDITIPPINISNLNQINYNILILLNLSLFAFIKFLV